MRHAVPYWRLSAVYFVQFAAVGVYAPYFALYLDSIGFTAAAIGTLLSLGQLARIFGPNLWAWVADRRERPLGLARWTSGAAAVAFAGVYATDSFWGLFVVLAAHAFFASALMPVLETVTVRHLRGAFDRYGAIRLWGSVSFVLAVLAAGWFLDRAPTESVRWMVLVPLATVFAATLLLPEATQGATTQSLPITDVLRRPEVIAAFLAFLLMGVAHGPLYTFFSIYLDAAGYSKAAVGTLWALGVIAEILVFLASPAWLRRFTPRAVLFASFGLAVVRFVMIGWGVDSAPVLVVAQILHAATFGTFHVAALAVVNTWFTGNRQVRGQALYLSLSFGAGGFFGAIGSGLLWETIGPAWTFTCGSAVALAGLIVLATRAKLLPASAGSTRA